ncbi:Phosphatidylinositol 3-kinase catalytic subunit type 3 [Trichoplax sp. H2]|nr:Phosphatidylinositol 3-kinase catalytic subunit type 3 [Trichoplax sp. H2]|eukprot:RDD40387.1 Phosphatidylinositol 3-kinase catalytic subunit type 3 [Trichoplax sp. H2]
MAASDLLDKFNYVYSCDLDTYVYIKIGTLEGKRDRKCLKALVDDPVLKFSGLYESEKADLFVSCKVYDNNVELTLPTRTSYKPFSRRWNWNEWIKLPIKYSDLPRNAQIAITIWDIYGSKKAIPVGATTVSLFGKNG